MCYHWTSSSPSESVASVYSAQFFCAVKQRVIRLKKKNSVYREKLYIKKKTIRQNIGKKMSR